ncbi:Ktr system potassium uptake protein A [bacterium BMS3Abin07]|nr:Ktr system potassium uptake protein A [bacterium BMS3Abin07]GBE32629.1 Ktr system potassium uptake protein A [bacterium BMS3Bbin05]HDO23565.1 TrkA family potassium uptake protein [Nitrospirota bacterium]
MKKQFAVIGLGRFGLAVAQTLAENNCDVIAIDRDEAKVKAVADHVAIAIQMDAMDEQALREAGVQNVDTTVVSIGADVEASILVVMSLIDIGLKDIIAKAVNMMHGRVLKKIGVNRVVHPERDMAMRVAQSLIKPEFLEHIGLSRDYSIVELPAPPFLWEKTIKDSNLRSNYGINIIAIKTPYKVDETEKESWNINPNPSDVIKKSDFLVVLGTNSDIEKLQ